MGWSLYYFHVYVVVFCMFHIVVKELTKSSKLIIMATHPASPFLMDGILLNNSSSPLLLDGILHCGLLLNPEELNLIP